MERGLPVGVDPRYVGAARSEWTPNTGMSKPPAKSLPPFSKQPLPPHIHPLPQPVPMEILTANIAECACRGQRRGLATQIRLTQPANSPLDAILFFMVSGRAQCSDSYLEHTIMTTSTITEIHMARNA